MRERIIGVLIVVLCLTASGSVAAVSASSDSLGLNEPVMAGSSIVYEPVHPGDCDVCHNLYQKYGPNFCAKCHDTGLYSHPLNVDAAAVGFAPADMTWSMILGDGSGTRLWDGQIKCMTCHTPHNAVLGSKYLTMPYSVPGTTDSPICFNCHP